MLQVGLFIPAGWWCQREVLDGVAAFLDRLPPEERWECVHSPDRDPEPRDQTIFDGALASIVSDEHAHKLRPVARHMVGVMSCDSTELKIPHVVCDDIAVGAAGATELIARGYRDVAYASRDDHAHTHQRFKGFSDVAKAANCTIHYRPLEVPLRTWLTQLPKPIGVLATNDDTGKYILDACRAEGIRVPQDLAVLGIDNDPQLCELSWPPLASINAGHYQVGRRAAERLHKLMMTGEDDIVTGMADRPWVETAGFPEVIVRPSVDGLAVDDDVVAQALQYINAYAHQPVGVTDVCTAISVGRRSLEIRFRKAIGRTILQELHRSRVQVARRLLATRRLSVDEVATLSGFTNQTRLGVVFRRVTGMTPTAYRRRALGMDAN